jgi:acetyl-CoA acyltransferase
MGVLRAGFPVEVSAATVNRFCSSGLQTVAMAAQSIMTGLCDVVIAGGVEMMSVVPMGGHHTRLHPEMVEENIGMGFTAERVAKRWAITRDQADDFAFGSQQKAAAALQRGAFVREIVPVPVPRVSWKGARKSTEPTMFTVDELVRAETTREGLAKLKPAFAAKGVVTAGNSSPLSDGAAALLMMSADKAKELGLKPLARFVTFAVGGVAPDIMGVGPIKAVPKALAKSGLKLADLKMIELNEAFAVQGLAVMQELGMNAGVTNVNGGAIALGHPLGATGAKLTTQLVHALGASGGGLGMVTMCIGGGMGAAGIFEVYPA